MIKMWNAFQALIAASSAFGQVKTCAFAKAGSTALRFLGIVKVVSETNGRMVAQQKGLPTK